MTENKRFTITQDFEEHHRQIRDNGKIIMGCFLEPQAEPIVNLLNELHEENNELRLQLNLCSDQRNEFHRGARENANRVGELEEENKQLKHKLDDWHQRTFKAHEYFNLLEKVIDEVCNNDVSNKIWKEYEKREKVVE